IKTMVRHYSSRKNIETRQLKEIRKLVALSVKYVPYYKQCYQGLPPIESLADLCQYPVIQKSTIKQHGEEQFLNPGIKPEDRIEFKTSGSTGEPLRVFHDKACFDYSNAGGVRRGFATRSFLPIYRLFHIRNISTNPSLRKKRFVEHLSLFRRCNINAALPIEKIKQLLLKKKPDGIIAYPVYMRDLIANMSKDEIRQARKFLKVIFTESEFLSDHHRKYIRENLGTDVFDEYSAYEILAISYECYHHRTHIVEDRVLVEILDENEQPVVNGQEGDIVITCFMEKAMPLIRYKIGDRGILAKEKCPCGRNFKTLTLTDGRTNDYIVLPNGTKVRSMLLLIAVQNLQKVRECYVYQKMNGEINFYYVPLDKNLVDEKGMEKEILSVFSIYTPLRNIKVIRSDHIPRTNGGKARLIYSEIARGKIDLRS
ncbi:MAG: hypothetical protein U9N37_01810, partial [Thermodesulfobacteriota bacterium]|nr:hypothetical protein [Thermodesulfobacteriota bacterium]